MRVVQAVLTMGVVAALVTGCGGSEAETRQLQPPESERIDITLDGYHSPQTVGILMAESRGYFDEVGLQVWVRLPGSRLNPLRYVAERAVALAVSHQPQVVMARETGAPVAAFGSLVSQPTAAIIWLEKSKIENIADLEGKTIAITGLPFERSLLQSILARAGLTLAEVKIEQADYDLMPTLLDGRADAIFGSWNVEGAELEARGLDPVVNRVEDLGIPSYEELVLITRPDRLSEEPRTIRAFMAALARGVEAAIEEPEAAAELLAKNSDELSRKGAEVAVKATLPLLSESGRINLDRESDLVDWMHEKGLIPRAAGP